MALPARLRNAVVGSFSARAVAMALPENVAYRRSELTGSFVDAACLYLLEDRQNLTCRYFPNRRDPSGEAHEPFELA